MPLFFVVGAWHYTHDEFHLNSSASAVASPSWILDEVYPIKNSTGAAGDVCLGSVSLVKAFCMGSGFSIKGRNQMPTEILDF